MNRKLIYAALLGLLTTCVLCGCSSTEKEQDSLVVLNYGKYIEPSVIEAFEKIYNIDVKYEEYESPEEMYTKYKAGSINYDVICTSDYMVEKLIQEDELLEIDSTKLSNLSNIDSRFMELSQTFDPDNKYSIPYFYGTVGILYNTSMVTEPVNSWDILWDEQYRGSIIMENSVRDAFLVPLERLGYSLNTTTPNELDEALLQLKEQKDLVYAYLVDETADAMIANDAALAVVYSGEAATAMEYNDQLAYVVPTEGSNIWIDSWFVPKTCQHYDAALLWMDYLCSRDAAWENFNYVWYATPNTTVLDALSDEDKKDETIFPTDKTLDNCVVYQTYDDELNHYLNHLWKDLKSY